MREAPSRPYHESSSTLLFRSLCRSGTHSCSLEPRNFTIQSRHINFVCEVVEEKLFPENPANVA
jgi:hypothetical protein